MSPCVTGSYGQGWKPPVLELRCAEACVLAAGPRLLPLDVEAGAEHRVAERHAHHREDQDQLAGEPGHKRLHPSHSQCRQQYFTIAPMATKEDNRSTKPTMMAAPLSEMEEPEYLKMALQ